MHLERLIIFNYRSCRSIDIHLSDVNPNIFIGLNDSGKSTVLQAIDLLLGDKPIYNFSSEGNYKSDLSNSPINSKVINDTLQLNGLPPVNIEGNSTIVIGKLKYDNIEAENFPDINLTTLLQWSIECNEDNVLWVAKSFYNNRIQAYLLALETEVPLSLWSANQTEINKKIREAGVSAEDIQNENGKGRFSNFEKIRAIYGKYSCDLKWIEYKSGKSDREIFPSFNLFDWKTSLDEIVATANAIMQEEIKTHLDPIKKEANVSAQMAEEAINRKFGEISSIVKEVAKDVIEISSRYILMLKKKYQI